MTDKANLGHARDPAYEQPITDDIYAASHSVLRPGGHLVVVTKNTRRKDLTGLTVTLATAAEFSYFGHVIALHAAIRDGDLVARSSCWQVMDLVQARMVEQRVHQRVYQITAASV